MWRTFLVSLSMLFIGTSTGWAVELSSKEVDKNCWIEIFDDDEYDQDDPHVKIQGPAEYATLKGVSGVVPDGAKERYPMVEVLAVFTEAFSGKGRLGVLTRIDLALPAFVGPCGRPESHKWR